MNRYNKQIATHRQQARLMPTGKREKEEVDIDSCRQIMKFSTIDTRFWPCSRLMHEQQPPQHVLLEAMSKESLHESALSEERSKNLQEKLGIMNFLVSRKMLQKQRNGLQYKQYAFLLQLIEKEIEELLTDEKWRSFITIRNSPGTPNISPIRTSQNQQIQPDLDCKENNNKTKVAKRTLISNLRQPTQICHSLLAHFLGKT